MSKAELLWLEPVYKEMIWGSENWTVSAHPHGDCRVRGGVYDGRRLSWLWEMHPELFGMKPGAEFPLLVKVIDARDDLSIQVHPDDAYARIHEDGSQGKTECWYVLDCEPDTRIIIGHHAKTKEELAQMIESRRWNELLREIPVHKGDFFQINPGCIHAIKGGTRILETQQNSDITYRLYDYERLKDGKPRELQISQSLDVVKAPSEEAVVHREVMALDEAVFERLVECPYYEVDKVDVSGVFTRDFTGVFTNVSIIEGKGTADQIPVQKGDTFIIPYGYGTCVFEGDLSFICSHPNNL